MVIIELKMQTGFIGFAGGLSIILGTFFLMPSPHWLLSPEISKNIRNTIMSASLVIIAIFTFIILKASQTRRKAKAGHETLIGKSGKVTTRLDPAGEINVSGKTWRARAEKSPIEIGSNVEVIDREGSRLIVRFQGEANEENDEKKTI
jgi:membrane-bound ClpP family serine protease